MDEFIVNQHIMEICKQRNLSIYRLAKMSDMPYSSLNNMIKHRHVPTIYNLIKICNGLNISLSQFFAGIEDNVDNNVLSSEQQDVLSLWNLLDSKSKEFALIYMKELAHLPIIGVEDEKF